MDEHMYCMSCRQYVDPRHNTYMNGESWTCPLCGAVLTFNTLWLNEWGKDWGTDWKGGKCDGSGTNN